MPDVRPPLDPHRLADAAPFRVEVVEAAASTNALVAQRAREGEPAGLVVVAEHQQAGRGRLDRVWHTPPRAALTVSLLIDPDVPAERWPLLPLLAGYVLQTTLSRWTSGVALKWPNDVLVAGVDGSDRKISGILVERVEGPDRPLAVVGLGVNVSQSDDELPVQTATSLLLEMQAQRVARGETATDGDRTTDDRSTVDRTTLLQTLLADWQSLAGPLLADPSELMERYRSACRTVGQTVDVHLPGGRVHTGAALTVEDDGTLVVADGDATLRVTAGDVVHVRPTS